MPSLLVASLALMGCAETHRHSVNGWREGRDAYVDRKVADKAVTVTFRSGRTSWFRHVRLAGDSLILYSRIGSTSRVYPIDSIRSLRYRDHGRGATEGMLVGAVAGYLAGYVFGMAQGDDPAVYGHPFPEDRVTAEDKALAGGILGGLLGGLVALPLGALVGYGVTHELPVLEAGRAGDAPALSRKEPSGAALPTRGMPGSPRDTPGRLPLR